MKELISLVKSLQKGKVNELIDSRLREFRETWAGTSRDVFREYCFCALTANFDAEKGIRIHYELGDGFFTMSEKQLAKKLRKLGYRFPNVRAKFIVKSREHMDSIKYILEGLNNDFEKREWLVENMMGLGYKEASHFLRNTGHNNLAIIDFHIIDLLEKHGLVKRPNTMTRKRYLEIENVLQGIAKKLKMSLGELDFYLWYLETGKVLK